MFARSKYGGDCAAIELYVFALLSDCGCKYTKYILMLNEKDGKNVRKGIPLAKILRETGEKVRANRERDGM
jgi:hypothetical protein